VALEDGTVVGNDKVNLADCCDGQADFSVVYHRKMGGFNGKIIGKLYRKMVDFTLW